VDDQVRGQVGGLAAAHQEWADGLTRDELRQSWAARWWGSQSGWWLSWMDTYTRLGVRGLPDAAVDAHLRLGRSCGWWFPFRGGVVLTDRPCQLHLDRVVNRRGARPLHREDGPALLYRDGWGLYMWHGTRVPAWVVLEPTLDRIFAEQNAEVRRCAIESFGWDRLLDELGTAPVDEADDPGNPGKRLRLFDLPSDLDPYPTPVRLLVCVNGSPERDGTVHTFGLTVPAETPDAVAAAAWTYDLSREQYLACARRT